MPPSDADARSLVARHAAALLRELAELPAGAGPVRVTDAAGGLACLVQVWVAGAKLPTAGAERARAAATGGRDACRADVLAAVRAADRPLTRKQVVRALRAAGLQHGAGTVAKALADLTRSGELVNMLDKRGYRLPGWVRPTPGLFDEE
jgi:hypothetical protein